jgi:hypothetical protein
MPALKIKHSDRTAQGTVGESTLQIPEPERSFETVNFDPAVAPTGARSAPFVYTWIQVQSDADCYIKFSKSPTDNVAATPANCFWYPANATLTFAVPRDHTLHVIPA